MDRFEAEQNNAAFNELRGFWENGTDPLQALNYLRTKYSDSALQYAAGELAFYRPRNDAYRVGDSFPELENYQFSTPRAPQVSPIAQDMGAQVANRAYAFTHQPQPAAPASNTYTDPIAEYRTYIQNGTMNPVIYRAKGDTGNPEHDAYYTQAGGKIVSDEDIIRGILRNEYGTGNDRRNNLLNLGLSLEDIKRIQGLVNARMYAAQARPSRVSAPQSRPVKQRQLYQGMPMSGKWPR